MIALLLVWFIVATSSGSPHDGLNSHRETRDSPPSHTTGSDKFRYSKTSGRMAYSVLCTDIEMPPGRRWKPSRKRFPWNAASPSARRDEVSGKSCSSRERASGREAATK